VSAGFFYGDGRHLINLPSGSGGTMTTLEAGNGIKITVDGVVTTTAEVSAIMAVSSSITIDDLTLEGTGNGLFVHYNARINGHTSAADATFTGNVTATAYWGDGSNLTNITGSTSVTSFTANNLGVVVKASITDSYIGHVSGSSAHFTAEVCAVEYYGDGSNLTNLPTASTSVVAFTVNQLTVVSSSILVSATADSLVVSGNVSATAYYGSGANLTDIVLPTSGTDLKVNNLNVGVMTSTTALTVGAIASIGTDLVVGGDIYVSGGSIEIKTDSGSPALIDLYCETGNAHYTRLQAPTHAALVGGSIIATMPVSSTQLAGVSTTDIFTTKTFADQTNFSTGITVVGNVTAAAYWGDGANLTNVPAAASANIFTVNQLNVVTIASVTRLAVGTVSVTGQVSGVGMTLSGNVTAVAYWGSGSNLTGIATTDEIIALAIALG